MSNVSKNQVKGVVGRGTDLGWGEKAESSEEGRVKLRQL